MIKKRFWKKIYEKLSFRPVFRIFQGVRFMDRVPKFLTLPNFKGGQVPGYPTQEPDQGTFNIFSTDKILFTTKAAIKTHSRLQKDTWISPKNPFSTLINMTHKRHLNLSKKSFLHSDWHDLIHQLLVSPGKLSLSAWQIDSDQWEWRSWRIDQSEERRIMRHETWVSLACIQFSVSWKCTDRQYNIQYSKLISNKVTIIVFS